MRVSVPWWSILLVALLFIGQAMLLVFVLQPPPDSHIHSESQSSLKASPPPNNDQLLKQTTSPNIDQALKPSPSNNDCPSSSKEQSLSTSLDYEAMAYLYDKFRVAATEVKRQVLKGKGEQVPGAPPKIQPVCKPNLIVATYNLWNINPPWPTRANKIAELLIENQAHIVGVQEIRKYESMNQLDILKDSMPVFKYSVYERVQTESIGEEEGIGILSQYPIIDSSAISFENTNRKCLRGLIETPQGKVNFFVTHFSLNDQEQCSHAFVLWEYMNSFPSDIPQILVGDMNTYFDFEWPMDLLTLGLSKFMLSQFNPCSSVFKDHLLQSSASSDFHVMKDVWEELYPAVPKSLKVTPNGRWWGTWPSPPGHTFSNYGDQDPSRTDRMYYYPGLSSSAGLSSSSLQLCQVNLFGDQPISGQSKKLFPSDHKGVAGHFLLE